MQVDINELPEIGTKVRHKVHGEHGVIETYRPDGLPLIRWSSGRLLRCSWDHLEYDE